MASSANVVDINCSYPLCSESFATVDLYLDHIQVVHLFDSDVELPMQEEQMLTLMSSCSNDGSNPYNDIMVDEKLWAEINKELPENESQDSIDFSTSNSFNPFALLDELHELMRTENQERVVLPVEMQSDTLGLTVHRIPESLLVQPMPIPCTLKLLEDRSTTSSDTLEAIETPSGCTLEWLDQNLGQMDTDSQQYVSQDNQKNLTTEELQLKLKHPSGHPEADHTYVSSKFLYSSKETSHWPRTSSEDINWAIMCREDRSINSINDPNSETTMSAVDQSDFIEDERELAFRALSQLSAYDEMKSTQSSDSFETSLDHPKMKLTLSDLIPYRHQNDVSFKCSPSKLTLKALLYPTPKKEEKKSNRKYRRKTSREEKPVMPEETPVYYSYDFLIKEGLKRRSGRSDKPYACPVPTCEKTYKNANGMKYHARYGHSPRQEFPCPQLGCTKIYTTKHGLNAHCKIHPGWEASKKDKKVKKLKIHLPKPKVEQCSSEFESDDESQSQCSTTNSFIPTSQFFKRESPTTTTEKKLLSVDPEPNINNPLRIKLELREPIDESLLSYEVMDEISNDEPIKPSPSFLRTEFNFNSPTKQFALSKGAFTDVRRRLNFSGSWSVGKNQADDSPNEEASNSLYFFPQQKTSMVQ